MSIEIKVKNSGFIELTKIVDERDGHLCVAESNRNIPFEIKRVYYINHLENFKSIRGHHAHKALQQVIFCINGSFKLELDDGTNRQTIDMWQDNIGIILGPRLWHTMHSFSCGSVLLVLASDYYCESDYIRNYDEFMETVSHEDTV